MQKSTPSQAQLVRQHKQKLPPPPEKRKQSVNVPTFAVWVEKRPPRLLLGKTGVPDSFTKHCPSRFPQTANNSVCSCAISSKCAAQSVVHCSKSWMWQGKPNIVLFGSVHYFVAEPMSAHQKMRERILCWTSADAQPSFGATNEFFVVWSRHVPGPWKKFDVNLAILMLSRLLESEIRPTPPFWLDALHVGKPCWKTCRENAWQRWLCDKGDGSNKSVTNNFWCHKYGWYS